MAIKKKKRTRNTAQKIYKKQVRNLVIIFFMAIFAIIAWLSYNVYQFVCAVPTSDIVIHGASQRVKNIIYKDLRVLNGEKIIELNLSKIQAYIKKYNWVMQVSVTRKLSGQLEINIIEKTPYFMWLNDKGNYRVINNMNELVNDKLHFPLSELIVIESGTVALENSDDIKFLIYKDLKVLNEIQRLSYNGYRWDIKFKNGIVLKLSENEISKSYDKFLKANNKYNLLQKDIEYIDATSAYKLYVMPNL